MLKQRIVTAIALAIAFLSALFGLDAQQFALFAGLAIGIGAWEWSGLSGLQHPFARLACPLVLGLMMALIFVTCGFAGGDVDLERVRSLLLAGAIWWALALLWVQGYPSSAILWGSIAARLAMGVMVLLPAWLGMVVLTHFDEGEWLILLVVLVVACADVGAYFSGRAFGRHKLAPAVSPGKTLEGLFGGLVTVLIVASLFLLFTPGHHDHWWQWAVIVAVTALASVLGDLLESMVKRQRGVKDSGVILPGHGGLLDRIDSLTAALPVFSLLYLLLIADGPWRS